MGQVDERVGTRRRADPVLSLTAMAFAAGFSLHGLDHLIRGINASPRFVMVVGLLQGAAVVLAVGMALAGSARAPIAAVVVGLGSAMLFSYGHLLPDTPPKYSDSFLSLPHTHVTWFSWVTAVAEIGTGLAFALAGAHALRRMRAWGG